MMHVMPEFPEKNSRNEKKLTDLGQGPFLRRYRLSVEAHCIQSEIGVWPMGLRMEDTHYFSVGGTRSGKHGNLDLDDTENEVAYEVQWSYTITQS